ncbi:MAG: DNA-binding response regulator [Ignavibacteriales bacterium CG12_big_fil_rev_8_21_14_0_65_30_8]|nr:MAG: DNA-binding response regulator [Ignavibacteriales bacterium CG12_big_fil_rev_8_21_14_0_65_30_8]
MTEIWIIEDNISYSRIIRSAINQSDWCKCEYEFTNVADALKMLSKGETPDIILTDINLPGMNGIDGIKEIKAINKEVEIIVLTVFDDNEKIFDAICNGANGYLLKNSTPEEIIEAIQIVVDGGSSINAGLARKVFNIFSSMKQTKNSYGLTKREKEILNYLVDGKTANEIAKITFTSPQTVQTHIKNIYHKVHVNTRSGLVSKALKEGLVPKTNIYKN